MSASLSIQDAIERLSSYAEQVCLIIDGERHTFGELVARIERVAEKLCTLGVTDSVVAVREHLTFDAVALQFALWSTGSVVCFVPPDAKRPDAYFQGCEAEFEVTIATRGEVGVSKLSERAPSSDYLGGLMARGEAGLVLFSSGTTGVPKAALHKTESFLGKFVKPGKSLSTLAFLVYDHVAGQDTLLYALMSGGTLCVPSSRQPAEICALIEQHQLQVLPASPAFLNLMLVARAHEAHDCSSVEIITYGSEPMSQFVLDRVADAFPNARLIQKYGTTEFGALRSASKSNNSLLVQFKSDEADVEVRDGILWIKASTTMLGYLNAPSPFDDQGWYCTGDRVQQEGEWLHILGRESDIINVGGEKVSPVAVEAVLLELEFISGAVVSGEQNALLGNIVVARVSVTESAMETRADTVSTIKRHCRGRLARYEIPARISLTTDVLVTERQKRAT